MTFVLLPSFNYSKIFGDVVSWTSPHYNLDADKTVNGIGFSWKAFMSTSTMGIGKEVETAASFWYMMLIIFDIFFYLLLTWYFDKILE